MPGTAKSIIEVDGKGMRQKLSVAATDWKTLNAAAADKLLQLCLTLCDPIDGSPPGSSIPGILQARVLEWVAIAFSVAVAIK